MKVSGFTIDVIDNRASINVIEKPGDILAGSSGIVSVPIQSKDGETIEEAKKYARLRAADALELVARSLRNSE